MIVEDEQNEKKSWESDDPFDECGRMSLMMIGKRESDFIFDDHENDADEGKKTHEIVDERTRKCKSDMDRR